METAVVKYDKDVAIIKALDEKYKGITIRPDNKDDYAIVMGGLKEYRGHRVEIDEWHRTGKAKALKRCKEYDAEKNKWRELITPGENTLKATRKIEDDRIAEIETKRIKGIRTMLNDIRNLDYKLPDLNLAEMKELKKEVEGSPVTEEDYHEFVGEAMANVHNVLIAINNAIEQRERLDREEAERKAENERLEKIRVEQEAAQVKIDEANRKTEEAQKKIDDEKREIEKQKRDLEADKQAEIDRIEREAFEKQVKENATREAEKEAERAVAIAKELAEAKEKEMTAQAEAQPDKEKLLGFADYLDQIMPPTFKAEKCTIIAHLAIKEIQAISTRIREAADEL